ncbi:MAG: murein biosynthesis integral membrane protein MurJ [Verrucomicrobiota bacterium]
MLKSSGAMGLATLTSRVLGMAREIVYANFMGDTAVASAFKLAFQIPNLFRRLLGEGALTVAFIPIFKAKEKTAGEVEMWRAANAVISGLIVAASVLIGVAMLGITIALSVHAFDENTRLMLRLLRLMFPYLLMVCLAAIFMGMLNARGHFFIPAMGAVVLNVVLISSVLFLAPMWGKTMETKIFAVAIGVLLAGVAQAIFQWPNLRREGFRYRWISPWKNETVREVVRKMVPGMMGVAAFQINVLVTNSVAYHVDDHIVASFDYAVRLMELPQGIFGISLATYLLPTLTGLAADKKFPEFRATLGKGLSHLAFLNLIASVLLVILAEPMVRLIYEHGKFTSASTQRAALALSCLAPGLIAFSMVNILARAFYALGDMQTPMKISIVCLVLNLVFALLVVWPLRQAGLGLANSLSAIFNVGFLLYALRRKLKFLKLDELRRSIAPLLVAAICAGAAAWFASRGWERSIGHENLAEKFGAVFVPMTLAAAIYLAIALLLKVPSAGEMFNLVMEKLHLRGARK